MIEQPGTDDISQQVVVNDTNANEAVRRRYYKSMATVGKYLLVIGFIGLMFSFLIKNETALVVFFLSMVLVFVGLCIITYSTIRLRVAPPSNMASQVYQRTKIPGSLYNIGWLALAAGPVAFICLELKIAGLIAMPLSFIFFLGIGLSFIVGALGGLQEKDPVAKRRAFYLFLAACLAIALVVFVPID